MCYRAKSRVQEVVPYSRGDRSDFQILDVHIGGVANSTDWIVLAKADKDTVHMKADVGAQVNVLSLPLYRILK